MCGTNLCAWVALLGLAPAVPAGGAASQTQAGSIVRGRVTGPDGRPVGGARVTVLEGQVGTCTTDSKGRFAARRTALLPDPPKLIFARHAGKGLAAVVAAPRKGDAEIQLHKGVTLTGRIVRPDRGKLQEAHGWLSTTLETRHPSVVSLRQGSDLLPGQIDRTGRYTIAAVPPGRVYFVDFTDNGCGHGYRRVDLRKAKPGRVTVGDVALPAAEGEVSGIVLDIDGRPAAGAPVRAILQEFLSTSVERTVKADAKGRFRIAGIVDEGPVKLYVWIPKGGRRRRNIRGYAEVKVGARDAKIELQETDY